MGLNSILASSLRWSSTAATVAEADALQQRAGLRIQLGHGLAELLGEPEVMAAAFLAGADGYLIKGSSQSLVSAIRTVVRHAADRTEEVTIGHSIQPLV